MIIAIVCKDQQSSHGKIKRLQLQGQWRSRTQKTRNVRSLGKARCATMKYCASKLRSRGVRAIATDRFSLVCIWWQMVGNHFGVKERVGDSRPLNRQCSCSCRSPKVRYSINAKPSTRKSVKHPLITSSVSGYPPDFSGLWWSTYGTSNSQADSSTFSNSRQLSAYERVDCNRTRLFPSAWNAWETPLPAKPQWPNGQN